MFFLFLGCATQDSNQTCDLHEDSQIIVDSDVLIDSETAVELLDPIAICQLEKAFVLLPESSTNIVSSLNSYDPEGYSLSYDWTIEQYSGNPMLYSPHAMESTVYVDALGDYNVSLTVKTFDDRYGYCSVQFSVTTTYDLWFHIYAYPNDVPLVMALEGPSDEEYISSGLAVEQAELGDYTLFIGAAQGNPTFELVVDIYIHGEFIQQVYRPTFDEVYAPVFTLSWPSLIITE